MRPSKRSPWFFRYLLALGIAMAAAFLVDGKFLLLLLAMAWIIAVVVALARVRRQRA